MDTNGILQHARTLAAELGPGDPAATIAALVAMVERGQQERDRLCAMVGVETPIAALTLRETWHAERALLWDEIAAYRRAALALRDAWRAERADAELARDDAEITLAQLGEANVALAALRARVADLEADKEVARILSLSDEEVLDEVRAEGHDPEQVAAEMRALFERTLASLCDPWPEVRDAAGLGAGREG